MLCAKHAFKLAAFRVENDCSQAVLSNTAKYLAVACASGDLVLYDVATGEHLCRVRDEVTGFAGSVSAMRFSVDDQRVVVVLSNRKPRSAQPELSSQKEAAMGPGAALVTVWNTASSNRYDRLRQSYMISEDAYGKVQDAAITKSSPGGDSYSVIAVAVAVRRKAGIGSLINIIRDGELLRSLPIDYPELPMPLEQLSTHNRCLISTDAQRLMAVVDTSNREKDRNSQKLIVWELPSGLQTHEHKFIGTERVVDASADRRTVVTSNSKVPNRYSVWNLK